jgi:hypothetical protein
MSSLGKRIEAAIDDERHSVEIDIGGDMVRLYAKPITGNDMDKVLRKHPNFQTAPSAASIVDMIILKAQVEDGSLAFDATDRPILVRRPIAWLMRLQRGLFPNEDTEITDEKVEAEVGNS